jgi:hypothetical protein
MKQRHMSLPAIALVGLLAHAFACADQLKGQIDQASGPKWQSTYMDLEPPRDFKSGERLQIKLQGSAQWVRVRLLPQDARADRPTGALEGKMRVPPGGLLEITLQKDHLKVKQISVHAGKEAFGDLLGTQNGEAEIVRIDVLPRK